MNDADRRHGPTSPVHVQYAGKQGARSTVPSVRRGA